MIGHEEGIEPGVFQRLNETLGMFKIEVRIRERAGITPCARVNARGPHESVQVQSFICAH
jgi:hypothetical protein